MRDERSYLDCSDHRVSRVHRFLVVREKGKSFMTIDEFVAKHGFPGTPAGDRMRADLLKMVEGIDRNARAYAWEVGVGNAQVGDAEIVSSEDNPYAERAEK